MTLNEEEDLYLKGYWFDGVEWTKVDSHYIDPEDRVRKNFRKLLNPEGLLFVRKEFNRDRERALLKTFLAYKEVEFTDWHERGLSYWGEHPGLCVLDVVFNGKLIAEDVELVYEKIVVVQQCLPVNYDEFYAVRGGHLVDVNLAPYWGKRVYVGSGERYRYVNGH